MITKNIKKADTQNKELSKKEILEQYKNIRTNLSSIISILKNKKNLDETRKNLKKITN